MGFFDDQLEQRRRMDSADFADAMDDLAGAVMGNSLRTALSVHEVINSAIEEILHYYHFKMGEDEQDRKFESPEEQIEYCMRPFGIMSRGVELDSGWYHHASGIMLGTLQEDGSAVALVPGKISGYSFVNLNTGKHIRLNKKTEKLLDRQALCFYQPLPMRAITIRDLGIFLLQQFNLSDGVLYVGMMAVSALLGLLSPKFANWLFGDVLASGSLPVLMALASFMVCFSVCKLCISTFQKLVNARISIKQSMAGQAAVMSRLMSLPASFFKNYSSGELTQRANYVQDLCSMLMETVGTVGLSSVFSLIYLNQTFAFAPSLLVPSLLMTVCSIAVTLATTWIQRKVSEEKMMLSSKLSGLTYATITGIEKIKLAGAEKRMFSRWARLYAKEAKLTFNPPAFLKLSSTITLSVSLIGTMVLYHLAVKNHVSIADYYAFNAAYGMVSAAFTSLASIAASVATFKPILDMAKPIMEAEPEMTGGRQMVTELRGSIEMSNVSFRYREDMPLVIDDLSLKIKAGEYVAVVGETGCGKSTLLRLLLGFEKPLKGRIYFDRKDISQLDLKSLRSKIGVVMQDGKLFAGDIYSNIVISKPSLTLRDAWEAAEIADVADDIRAMPMGMQTIISEGQGGISGGQKQRLMIARAVASKPKILIFDEATSALDNITQKKVSEAIDSLKCTRIVIAHRLTTIRNADRIICLQGGKIAEEGTYEELMEKRGMFTELVKHQQLEQDE